MALDKGHRNNHTFVTPIAYCLMNLAPANDKPPAPTFQCVWRVKIVVATAFYRGQRVESCEKFDRISSWKVNISHEPPLLLKKPQTTSLSRRVATQLPRPDAGSARNLAQKPGQDRSNQCASSARFSYNGRNVTEQIFWFRNSAERLISAKRRSFGRNKVFQ